MRLLRWLIGIAVVAAIGWRFPLFHIVPQKTAVAEKAAVTFDAASFAESFWTNQLAAAMGKAVKAEVLIPAIYADAGSAKTNYSRSVDMGDAYFYFLSGTGKVLVVSEDEIALTITPGATNAEISLQTGPVFGNAVRDGTGLLNASDYPNSQDFNDLSAALNHIVETNVLPKLHEAKVGATVAFAGCAEVDDESSDLKPLKVIPIQATMEGGKP